MRGTQPKKKQIRYSSTRQVDDSSSLAESALIRLKLDHTDNLASYRISRANILPLEALVHVDTDVGQALKFSFIFRDLSPRECKIQGTTSRIVTYVSQVHCVPHR